MSKTYASSKQRPQKQFGIRSKKVEPNGNGRAERIQLRAYEIYQERIRKNILGDEISDWIKAEQEVNSRKTGM